MSRCNPCLVVLALCLPLSAGQDAQQQAIRVQTTLVSVPAIVTDAQGRFVPDLKAADFALYEDDARQSIAVFAATEESLHIALLLDSSRSTVTVLKKIKKAASEFVSNLRPQDRAMIMSFDHEVRVLSRWKGDRKMLEEDIRRVEVGSYPDTKLRDALFEVMRKQFSLVEGRKAVVLLSDGQDVGSRTSVEDLFSAIAVSGIVIYPVHYRVDPKELMKKLFGISSRYPDNPNPDWKQREKEGQEFLNGLAVESAGQLYFSEIDDLKKTFKLVTQELRHQYLLGFYPDKSRLDGNPHALRVLVSRPGAQVRARRYYRAF